MATKILLKSGVGMPASATLVSGEIAVDSRSGEVYTKLDNGAVSLISGKQLTGDLSLDGGSANSIFTPEQLVDGGSS
jgi:hypothetical protein